MQGLSAFRVNIPLPHFPVNNSLIRSLTLLSDHKGNLQKSIYQSVNVCGKQSTQSKFIQSWGECANSTQISNSTEVRIKLESLSCNKAVHGQHHCVIQMDSKFVLVLIFINTRVLMTKIFKYSLFINAQ